MTDFLSKKNGIYQSPFKVIPLLIFEISSAFLMSFYFRQLLSGSSDLIAQTGLPAGQVGGGLIWFLVGLGLFVIFSFLSALFINGLPWSSLAAGLSVIASLAVFYDYFSTVLIVFGIFIFLIFVWAIRKLRLELEDTLKIRFFRLVKVFLSKVTLGLAIMISLFGYFLLPAGGGFPVSLENFQFFVLKPNEGLISIFVPNFKFQTPIQTVLAGLLEPQLAEKVPNYKNLPASAKEIILESAIRQQFLDGLEKSLGTKIDSQESVGQAIYDSLAIKFSQLDDAVKNWITIGIFVLLFFTIQFIFIPIKWLLSFLLFLIYLFLLAIKFVHIRLESRSKEVLQM